MGLTFPMLVPLVFANGKTVLLSTDRGRVDAF